MLDRLRNDFQLAIIVLCGGLAAVAILPFTVYRFARGDYWIGALDLLMCLAVFASAGHAWTTGRPRWGGIVICVLVSAVLVVISVSTTTTGLRWFYVMILANFFIAPRWLALWANSALIAAPLLPPETFPSTFDAVTFVVTAGLVGLFAFIFAWRTESQRLQLEELASHDPLTGAGNRRLMELELRQTADARRSGSRHYAVALLDLDHFKQVNDRFGHDAGDEVLRAFAGIVRGSIRKFDRFYRFGGEEFVLLLPVGDETGVSVALTKVHRQLREHLHCSGGPVSVSIGAALLRPDENWTNWLARADAALYRAKRDGRDRLVIDGDAAPLAAEERRAGEVRALP